MSDAREKRVPFMMSERELASVDDWRFKNRIPTRADALRRLCKLGMALDMLMPDLEAALGDLLHASLNFQSSTKDAGGKQLEEATHIAQGEFAVAAIRLGKAVGLMNQNARAARTEKNLSDGEAVDLEEKNRQVMSSFDELESLIQSRQR